MILAQFARQFTKVIAEMNQKGTTHARGLPSNTPEAKAASLPQPDKDPVCLCPGPIFVGRDQMRRHQHPLPLRHRLQSLF